MNRVNRVQTGEQEQWVSPDQEVLQVSQELMDHRVHQVQLVNQDQGDLLDLEVMQDLKDNPDPMDNQV